MPISVSIETKVVPVALGKVMVRSAFAYDVDVVSLENGLECKDVSKTQQSQADEADINTIVRRFKLTGQLPENVKVPVFADTDGELTYKECLDMIRQADQSFSAMPADVRARFGNDPANFVEFCSDEKNLEEMRKLGLAVPAAVVESVPGPVA